MNLRRSSGYNTLLMLLQLSVTIASIPILVRKLGVTEYGVWSVLLSVNGISLLALLGLDTSLTVFLAKVTVGDDERAKDALLGTSFLLFTGLGCFTAGLIWLGSPYIVKVLFPTLSSGRTVLQALIPLGGVVLLQFVKQWLTAVETGLMRYDLQTFGEGISVIVSYTGLMVVVLLGYRIVALANWFFLVTFLTVIFHIFLINRSKIIYFSHILTWSQPQARVLLKFGILQWASQVGGTLFSQFDRIMVNLLLGPTAVGLYAVATSITSRINLMSAIPIQPIVPSISTTHANKHRERTRQIFAHAQHANAIIVYFITAVIILGAVPICNLLVTAAHARELIPLLQLLALLYGVYSLNAVGFYVAMGIGRPAINARWVVLSGFLFAVLLIVLIPRFGLWGAVWANIGYSLTLAINVSVIRELGISLRAYVGSQIPLFSSLLISWLTGNWLATTFHSLWFQIVTPVCVIIILLAWVGGLPLYNEALHAFSLVKRLMRLLPGLGAGKI